MFQPIRIAPSILSADFMNLESQIKLIEDAGAGFVHFDVMDGHFVPNLTIGVPVLKQLKKVANIPVDVHLMIENPLEQLPWFLDAGADMVTVHAETLSTDGMRQAIEMIHNAGAKAGIAVKPGTTPNAVASVIFDLDMVLIMSVEPGFSGQSYIEGSEDKVAHVCSLARQVKNTDMLIEVDGGIGVNTVERVARAGADVIVCGNAVYAAPDPAAALVQIQDLGNAARLEVLDAQGL